MLQNVLALELCYVICMKRPEQANPLNSKLTSGYHRLREGQNEEWNGIADSDNTWWVIKWFRISDDDCSVSMYRKALNCTL